MNIIILHGENTDLSYKRLSLFLNEAKKRKWKVERLGKTEQDTYEQIRLSSLFDKNRLLLIEEPKGLSGQCINYINKNSSRLDYTLVIYAAARINNKFLSKFPKNTKIEEYKIPVLIFKFLESFIPGNSKNCIKLFHNLLKNQSQQFIMAMLGRHFKDLIWVKNGSANIPYPSWRVDKLETQASKFSQEMLRKFINELASIDMRSKSSSADLTMLLDFKRIRMSKL